MIIAGLQKSSLIDYPGKLSCVAFLTGCNFACPYCHNPQLARGRYPQLIKEDELLAFLSERRHFLEAVVITGGEPTLSPGLPDLCRAVRDLGLAVKLDTNGSRPTVLAGLIKSGLLDYIAMDIKTAPADYAPAFCDSPTAAGIAQSIDIILASGLDHEFRTTCVKPFIDEAVIGKIARTIFGARRYILQNYHPADMLCPESLDDNPGFALEHMQRLLAIAAPWLPSCTIR